MNKHTRMQLAQNGGTDALMRRVASDEAIDPEILRKRIADGTAVIPSNRLRSLDRPAGIGEGLRVKVNANIGTSALQCDPAAERKKVELAVDAGADALMDLSTGGNLRAIRREVIAASPVPVGTVPIYDVAVAAGDHPREMTVDQMLDAIAGHAQDGVDFMTIHCGLVRHSLDRLKFQGRRTGIVSRGGGLLAEWMEYHNRENPLYEHFDDILAIAAEHDVCLSLGDGLRPGAVSDASDRAQMHELIMLGELVDRSRQAGVQVMVEGPGHVPLNQIAANIVMEKQLCHGAPFYVLGPLVTDIAPGYDHITSAIGGAVAAMAGADFLCYVTPAEHLHLPDASEVRQGVMASRIAAHSADLARGLPLAVEWDKRMAKARAALDWKAMEKIAIDPLKVRNRRVMPGVDPNSECSMCGELCPMKLEGSSNWRT